MLYIACPLVDKGWINIVKVVTRGFSTGEKLQCYDLPLLLKSDFVVLFRNASIDFVCNRVSWSMILQTKSIDAIPEECVNIFGQRCKSSSFKLSLLFIYYWAKNLNALNSYLFYFIYLFLSLRVSYTVPWEKRFILDRNCQRENRSRWDSLLPFSLFIRFLLCYTCLDFRYPLWVVKRFIVAEMYSFFLFVLFLNILLFSILRQMQKSLPLNICNSLTF